MAVTTGNVVSYEWAVSVDGEDWTVVETEDDDTFGVTADLLGMYVKVTVTDDEANVASDVTAEPVAENEETGEIEILAATATAANEVTVTLENPVISSDTTIEITKGTNTITTSKTSWADTFDSVVLTTDANLSEGTYVVTLTSKKDETNTDFADFNVEKQGVYQIVIDSEEALTDSNNHRIAYAHYDVVDQYGTSVRNSTSITWAGSAEIKGDKATGKLTITKTGTNDWIYGEQIYVTGVYAKTGLSVQKTLTVGSSQALDSLEIAGFVKKGTTNIVQTLPADFKSQTYYILFNALDQNGTQMAVGTYTDNDVTFVSDNVLVIKEFGDLQPAGLTIEGVEYGAAFVEPGINVAKGGLVTVTAIANKTGKKTEIPVTVGIDSVVASFTLLAPTETVADGDSVEIPFIALDKEGNQITKFDTLAKQETFNTLSFTASEGKLKLAEQLNGSAKLTWTDKTEFQGAAGWTQSQATDGIDRPVSLTVVVVGGDTDNELISVEDKRRPNAIVGADMDKVYTEGATITFDAQGTDANNGSFESFQFVDQYNKTIKGSDADEKFGDSTGFFRQAEADSSVFSSSDLKNYLFGVRATYAGSGEIALDDWGGQACRGWTNGKTGVLRWAQDDGNVANGPEAGIFVYETATDIASAATGEGFKFEIAKIDPNDAQLQTRDADDWESVSPAKYQSTTVVDLSQVKQFTISDLNKFFVGQDADWTGDGQVASGKAGTGGGKLNDNTLTGFTAANVAPTGLQHNTDYQQDVEVKGTYNGEEVTIPAKFYKATGDKLSTATVATAAALGINTINHVISWADTDNATKKGLAVQDLYDKSSSMGLSKDAEDTIKASLYNIYGENKNTVVINYNKLAAGADVENAADSAVGGNALVDGTPEIAIGAKTLSEVNDILAEANSGLWSAYWTLTNAGKNDAAAAVMAKINALMTGTDALAKFGVGVYDTTSIKVTISDQTPVATTITGLKDAFTIAPTDTEISKVVLQKKIGVTDGTVKVVDQYGVAVATDLSYRGTNVVENTEGYAQNNFRIAGNDSADFSVPEGAERGDTFDLVLTQGKATATTKITVNADVNANIENATNNYLKLIEDKLEPQRLAGLS